MKDVLKIDEWVESKKIGYDAWKETGLLEGFSFEESMALCVILNRVVILLTSNATNTNSVSGTLLIPIIVRLYKKYNYLIKSHVAVYMFVNSQLHLLKSAETSILGGVDYQAEFVDLMCKKIKELGL